eukprot:TRINITY_DN1065_c0_g1_i1.p1 TRINITY_DN1065_c0_g1~~TRINITY_DN1065_c0_g1_i1.p1  ORF type:complete len:755 (-),score=117.75 TRINITY_DN1065_c0_g1_i1:16-2280(-)
MMITKKCKKIEFDGDSTVSFVLELADKGSLPLALVIPDNYQKEEFTLLTPNDLTASSDIKIYPAGRLKTVMSLIIKDYEKKKKAKKPKKVSDEEDWEDEDEFPYDDEFDGENWDEGGDDLLGSIDPEVASLLKDKIEADVKQVRKKYGSCGFYVDDVVKNFIVRLAIDTGFLDKWTAAAWGINNKLPIIVELQFTWQYLNDGKMPPKVLRIVQSKDSDLNKKSMSHTQDFGLRWYLDNRLSDVLRRNWVTMYRNSSDSNLKAIDLDKLRKKAKKGSKKKSSKKRKSSKKKPRKKQLTTQYTKQLAQLISMGFDRNLSIVALESTSGNPDNAANMLLSPESLQVLKNSPLLRSGDPVKTRDVSLNLPGFGAMSKHQREELENFFGGNFLDNMVRYLSVRFHTCANSCVICDASLGYEGLKPTVCLKPLCTHSYNAYGLGFSLTSELQHSPEVVDVLITITAGAGKNKRANGADVFVPFPDSVQYTEKDKLGREVEVRSFAKGGVKDHALVGTVCDKLPSTAEMKRYTNEKELKFYLDSQDRLCYPLLRWITMSNRAHISPLPADKHIKEMSTPHQFVFVSDNPQKEARFRQLKAEAAKRGGKGSFYAFHGSAVGNWHSILRNGLKNYSNTNKMSAGAAYGPGIYLASNASTSSGYMVAGPGWVKSAMVEGDTAKTGNNFSCIALCEIVDYRNSNVFNRLFSKNPVNCHGGIYVVTEESIVVTRYFFVYSATAQGYNQRSFNAVADNLKLPEDIYT